MRAIAGIGRVRLVLLALCLLSAAAAALVTRGTLARSLLSALPLAAALLLLLHSRSPDIGSGDRTASVSRRPLRFGTGHRLAEIEQALDALNGQLLVQRQAVAGLAQDLDRHRRATDRQHIDLEQRLTELEHRRQRELQHLQEASARHGHHLARVHTSLGDHQREIAALEQALTVDTA